MQIRHRELGYGAAAVGACSDNNNNAVSDTNAANEQVTVSAASPILVTTPGQRAITLGVASFLEAALLWHAQHEGLLRERMREDVFRGNMAASLAPVVVFAISIPIAYFASSWGLLSWLLIFPLEWCIGRFVIPKDAPRF